MDTNELWDVVIVGYGVTGLAAAMYAGRLELKTLLIGENPGGIITWTDTVENYPGFIKLTGQELVDKLKAHAAEYKVPMEYGRIEKIQKNKDGTFLLKGSENEYHTKSVLIATGTSVKKLEVKGLKQFDNRGVQYCALCDGALFKGKDMAVVGGSDSAAKEAIVLSRYARKVYLIYRGDKIRPEPSNRDRLAELSNVEIVLNTNVTEFLGEKFLQKIKLDKPYKGQTELDVNAVFIAIGHTPLSDIVKEIGVKTNAHGEIIIDRDARTNVPGIFAAGDVVDTKFKQAIVGVGEAVVAVYSAFLYVSAKKK
ncbi:MAG: FAD-dependent oxidoreductase [Candidatus Diapherotrites archaeon]|nr:FAD-dependent oxidoreductase [Candidatus Diapherotrites archaeon]